MSYLSFKPLSVEFATGNHLLPVVRDEFCIPQTRVIVEQQTEDAFRDSRQQTSLCVMMSDDPQWAQMQIN